MSAIAAIAAAGVFAVPGSTAIPSGGGVDPIASASANPAILAPPDAIVGEADGTVDFVVRLAEEGLDTVTVDYTAANATALAGGSCNFDFKPEDGTLTFAVGDMSEHVSVEINDCVDVEGFEAFTLRLSSPVNGTIARASSRISIVDNDTVVSTPRIVTRDAVVDEEDGTAFVSVLLGGPAGQASNSTVTVDYATSNGTATAESDFDSAAGTLSFAPGETAKTVAIPISDDGGAEGMESFSVDLSSPSGATIADGAGVVTIGASDDAPSNQPSILAPADLVVGEGDGFVDLVVRLSQPGQNTVTVEYAAVNATALGGTGCNFDFTAPAGVLTFAPGETTKAVRVQILDCPDVEGFEAFTFVLSDAVNGAIARASARISIVDNDTVVATPRLFVRDAIVDEMDGFAYVSVLLGGPGGQVSNSTVTVDYATSNGTATAASDFGDVAGTLRFAPGETAKTVVVPIADDEATEPVESFGLSLTNPTLSTIADSSSNVLIGASDGIASSQPSIFAPTDSIVSEGDGFVDLVVRLSQPGQNTVTVEYAAVNATALGGTGCNFDFTAPAGVLTFAPGETTKAVRVQILDCPDVEGFEAFTFVLSDAVNGAIARASARISIVDNDTVVATPRLFVRDAVVDEKDGFAHVSVLLGGPRGQASNSVVTVAYATSDGTATAGADYTASSGTLSFAPGETAKTVPLAIDDDATVEGIESFTLDLSSPTNATIADGTGVVVIGRSDGVASSQPSILAPADLVVGEGDGFVDLMVSLAQPGQSTVSVEYAAVNSTALGGTGCNFDFTAPAGALTFAPGETTKAVRVQILDCLDVERLDAFTFVLSDAVNGAIARASARISIVDNDTVVATPKLAVRDAVVDEKDGFALVSVLLGGPGGESSNSTVTVGYTTANGSASAGADYAVSSGTLTFAPGETAQTVVVAITDDGAGEPAETFTLDLSDPTGATVLDGQGVVTIGASDAGAIALPSIFAPADVVVSEGAGYVDLVVDLSVPGQSPVSVHYATSNATALGGTGCDFDYTPVSGTVQFALGETTKVVRVQILDCPNVEDPEVFNFTISAPVNGLVSAATGKITICDNDGPVTLCGITLTPPNPTRDVGEDVQFTATGTNSDLSNADLTSQVTWASATTSVATITTGGLAHAVAGGTSTISATLGAISGSTLLTVRQVAQTITFGPLANKTHGDPDFAVDATASSGLPVGFAASGNCTVAGQSVHITGAGSCTITASQAGNASYLPAPNVAQTFALAKATQTISFGPLANKTYGNPDFAVGATTSSGLPVSFAASGNCTVAGQSVHITGAGSCTITASQPGNANYLAAPNVAQTFAIAKATQTIAFAALPNRNQGDPDFDVSATASSGLPVSFAASGSCTVSGSRVHLTGAGACTITASQPGNADWNAASPVARSFSIASPQSPPPPPPAGPPPPPTVPREPAATPAPGPRDTEVVYDPKRKTFLINVQYLLRNRSCRNPCPARAELRTRSGRRLYAVGKLPGDGRVVLGARRGIKLPRGRKVFFYIPIKLAQLRKVHFKTVGGYRYGETRLRVWLRTPRGEVLTVRDGRIRVSIARIKSGALPNLRGIL